MDRYAPTTPRKALALAAAALSALTIATTVLLPASVAAGAAESTRLLASGTAARPATAVSIRPGRIEVIGVRNADVAAGRGARTRA